MKFLGYNHFTNKNLKYNILLIFIYFASSCSTIKLTKIERHYLLADSTKEKFYLIQLIRKNQYEGKLGEIPLLMIDEQIIYDPFPEEIKKIKIKKTEIHNIYILESNKSVQVYGKRGQFGFIHIMTIGKKEALPTI